MTTVIRPFIPATAKRLLPNRWDLIAFPLILGFLLFATTGIQGTWAPISALQTEPISLDAANLPEYALRTTLRMLAAMIASIVFTLITVRWRPRVAVPASCWCPFLTSCNRCRCSVISRSP